MRISQILLLGGLMFVPGCGLSDGEIAAAGFFFLFWWPAYAAMNALEKPRRPGFPMPKWEKRFLILSMLGCGAAPFIAIWYFGL